MELIVNGLPQYGLVIHGPNSPGFKDRFTALVKDPADFDEEALRHSIIIENQTPQPILGITLAYRFYKSDGAHHTLYPGTWFSLAYGPTFYEARNVIEPGGQHPWNFEQGSLRYKIHRASRTENDDESRKNLDLWKPHFAASIRWSVDIDGALFFNDAFAFVGPDTALEFDKLETGVRARRDFIFELNRKLDDGEDVFAYAEQCASITIEQIEALYTDERSPDLVYTWEKKTLAKSFLMCWWSSGKQATIDLIRERANFLTLPLERFIPNIPPKSEEFETKLRAVKDLITELNQKLDDGGDVFALIERYASLTKPQAQAPATDARSIIPNLERHYARSKKATAMSVVMRRQKFGEQATIEWIRASAKNQIPIVRK
jgi:hypothetical protein